MAAGHPVRSAAVVRPNRRSGWGNERVFSGVPTDAMPESTEGQPATPARPLGELVRELEYRGLLRTLMHGDGAATRSVTGLGFDSRLIELGQLFVAVAGAEPDGHDYAADAV